MADTGPDEALAVVSRRHAVLEAVGPDGECKRDLVELLDVSRSTVDRAVRELEGMGLVERGEEGYRRTLAGRLALAEYERFASRVSGVLDGRPLLAELSPDDPFETAVLDGAEIVRPEPHSPNRPVTRLSELVRSARRVRAFAPAVFPQQVAAYRDGIVDRGMEADVILTEDVVKRLVTTYQEELSAALDAGGLSLRVADGSLPYSLAIVETDADAGSDADSTVGLLVYAADGSVSGFVGNDRPPAVEWAEAEFERRWESGTELPRPDGV
jgi:predicted transcriptional regulator